MQLENGVNKLFLITIFSRLAGIKIVVLLLPESAGRLANKNLHCAPGEDYLQIARPPR